MGRVVTHKKSGDLAVAGVVVRAVSCGVVQVQWRGTSAITNCNLHCVEISSRVGDAVLLHGVTPATVFGFRYNPHQELLYDLRVWDPGSQSSFTVLGVVAGDVSQPRHAATMCRHALDAWRSTRPRLCPWRFSVPANGVMLSRVCEVRRSEATILTGLGPDTGYGVFARADIAVHTKLFWRMGRTRMVALGSCGPDLRRYGMAKVLRPQVQLLCPSKAGFHHRSNDIAAIGVGFRVNFAGEGDTVNVRLEHGGVLDEGLCFTALSMIQPGQELLFRCEFVAGSLLPTVSVAGFM